MKKSTWILIAVVLIVLTIIGVIWYKNRKLLNKVADTDKTTTNKSVNAEVIKMPDTTSRASS